MNSGSLSSLQAESDQHHENWQQPSEGVVMAEHKHNATHYAPAGRTQVNGETPDKHTVFEIGSITKVFTSILLAEAVRDSKANFDDVVSIHLNKLPFRRSSPFHSITLSALATHTSGLPRLPPDFQKGIDSTNPYVHFDDQRLQKSMTTFKRRQLDQPGEYSYSNYGMGILGYLLTQIYDLSYSHLLKVKILDPLCMTSTYAPTRFAELPESVRNRIAKPHVAGKEVGHWELSSLAGAGAMISTAEDLIRFGTAHWNSDTPADLAISMAEVAKPRLEDQGLGWEIDGDLLTHDGRTGGFCSKLDINKKDKSILVFLANSATPSYEAEVDGDFALLQGYWSGVLTSSDKLRLILYVSHEGRAVIYSIDQNNAALLASKARFSKNKFQFLLPAISAIYEGELSNGELNGIVAQNKRDRSLKMTYSATMPELLRDGIVGKIQGDIACLNGYWWGYVGGKKKGLFVYIKVTALDDLSVIELYSPDQATEPFFVSSASLKNNRFKFSSDMVNGKFTGKLAKDGKSIKGFWRQGRPFRLTLYLSDTQPQRDET